MPKLDRDLTKQENQPTKLMETPFSTDSYVRDSENDSDWDYTEDNLLELPVEIKQWFDTQGYETRWVRYVIQGQMDMKNIKKNQKKGYEFVTREELPEGYADEYNVASVDSMKDFVASSDVVLMKVPSWKKEKVVNFLNQKAENQARIVKDLLRQNSNSEGAGEVETINNSVTKVVKGGKREVSFADKQKS